MSSHTRWSVRQVATSTLLYFMFFNALGAPVFVVSPDKFTTSDYWAIEGGLGLFALFIGLVVSSRPKQPGS